jgi:hypothetical protein
MKLVIMYSIGDNYTYSCDVTTPFEYESKERAIADFSEKLLIYGEKLLIHLENQEYDPDSKIIFAGMELDLDNFVGFDKKQSKEYYILYFEPKIYTLEEWWEKYNNENYLSRGVSI